MDSRTKWLDASDDAEIKDGGIMSPSFAGNQLGSDESARERGNGKKEEAEGGRGSPKFLLTKIDEGVKGGDSRLKRDRRHFS